LNSLGAGRAATARAESPGVARLRALSQGTHPSRDRAEARCARGPERRPRGSFRGRAAACRQGQ